MSSIFNKISFGRMATFAVLLVILLLGGCTGQPGYYVGGKTGTPETYSEPLEAVDVVSITNVGFEDQEDLVRVVISGSGPFRYNIGKTESPRGVVVKIPGVRLDAATNHVPVYHAGITKIVASEEEDAGEIATRIEIGRDTHTDDFQVIPRGNELYINFQKAIAREPDVVANEEQPALEAVLMATTVLDSVVDDSGDYVQVDIVADGKIEDFRHFTLTDPTRLVLDLPAMRSGLTATRKECNSDLLSTIRYGVYPDHVRVVLDCAGEELPSYQVASHAQGLRIWIGSGFEEAAEAAEESVMPGGQGSEKASEMALGADKADEPGDTEVQERYEVAEATDASGSEGKEEHGRGLNLVSVAEAAETDSVAGQEEATLMVEESEDHVAEEMTSAEAEEKTASAVDVVETAQVASDSVDVAEQEEDVVAAVDEEEESVPEPAEEEAIAFESPSEIESMSAEIEEGGGRYRQKKILLQSLKNRLPFRLLNSHLRRNQSLRKKQ